MIEGLHRFLFRRYEGLQVDGLSVLKNKGRCPKGTIPIHRLLVVTRDYLYQIGVYKVVFELLNIEARLKCHIN